MSNEERRTAKRVAYYAEAALEGLDVSRRLEVRLADLSENGAFVDSRTVLPAGAKARIRFTVAGREIDVLAEVRYSMPSFGMGMRFVDLAPADRAAIKAFVDAQS